MTTRKKTKKKEPKKNIRTTITNPRGCPSVVNIETAHAISRLISQLRTVEGAMIECGFCYDTYYSWKALKPEERTDEIKEFLKVIADGLQKRKDRLFQLALYGKAKDQDGKPIAVSTQSARWALARMHPAEFSENYIIKKLEKDAELEALKQYGAAIIPKTIIYKEKAE